MSLSRHAVAAREEAHARAREIRTPPAEAGPVLTVATVEARALVRPEVAAPASAAGLRDRAPRIGPKFAGVLTLTMTLGLVGLLWINTAIAEDAFRVHELRQEARAADDVEQAMERAVQAMRSPASIAARASALGMVAAGPPAFLLLPEGRVQGQPQPAAGSASTRQPGRAVAISAPGASHEPGR